MQSPCVQFQGAIVPIVGGFCGALITQVMLPKFDCYAPTVNNWSVNY